MNMMKMSYELNRAEDRTVAAYVSVQSGNRTEQPNTINDLNLPIYIRNSNRTVTRSLTAFN
jgi:hypothetical protein